MKLYLTLHVKLDVVLKYKQIIMHINKHLTYYEHYLPKLY